MELEELSAGLSVLDSKDIADHAALNIIQKMPRMVQELLLKNALLKDQNQLMM